MTETPTESTRIAYKQLVAPHILDDEPMIESLRLAVLRDQARTVGRVLLIDTIAEVKREPVALVETEHGGQITVEHGSILDTGGRDDPDAYLLVWEADTDPRLPQPEPLRGQADDQGVVRADLTEQHRGAADGQVTFKHGIEGDVLIRAFTADGSPIGYAFAVEIDTGEHQIDVQPVTGYLTAEPRPDHPETQEVPD